ncbi:unnamed protein product [Angiostrongylus costaricensis]|uniref:Leishmanolysin-like peptidase n=1 Tax=Angiostrongylus costaricensis TaxID=334426 RepID=A0A158PEU9_ANGCS|nr:unnamed protein product [Angiostrongylus costaricensis]
MQFSVIVQALVTTVCCAQYVPLSITVVRPAELDSFSKRIEDALKSAIRNLSTIVSVLDYGSRNVTKKPIIKCSPIFERTRTVRIIEKAEDHESHEVKLGFEESFLLQTRGLVLLIEDEARKHFGCPSLVGIEADSVDKIHLNEYIFGNELMTPFLSNVSNRFSYISAAILEETYFGERPWYRVNRSAILEEHESLWYGRGWGCTFAERSCFDFIADRTRLIRCPDIRLPFYENALDRHQINDFAPWPRLSWMIITTYYEELSRLENVRRLYSADIP